MTPAESAQLLAYTAAIDPRFNTVDADQAAARVIAWADVLSDVPCDYAAGFVRRAYRTERRWPLQPGEVRDGWVGEQARAAAAVRRSEPRTRGVPMPDAMRDLRDRLRADRQRRGGV